MRLPPALEMTARSAVGALLGPALRRWITFPARRAAWLERLGVDALIDVGANVGQYGAHVRLYGYLGAMYAYEPLSDAFRQLAARAAVDPRWKAHNVGLGREPGSATLHVAGNSQSSSLLAMLPRHVDAAPESAVVGTETVQLITLASVLDEIGRDHERCFVKIDAQGSERAILEGAGEKLARVCCLELELSLVPLYEGETLFADMTSWLATKGFELRTLGTGYVDRNGTIMQVDALFVRTGVG